VSGVTQPDRRSGILDRLQWEFCNPFSNQEQIMGDDNKLDPSKNPTKEPAKKVTQLTMDDEIPDEELEKATGGQDIKDFERMLQELTK